MKKYICSTFLRFRCFEIINSRLVASCTNLFLYIFLLEMLTVNIMKFFLCFVR